MAIVGFALDENAKYCACCLSNGSVALYDIRVAKKFNDKVRDASKRMGSTDEELDVSFPMYDPSNGKPIVAEVDPPEIVQVPTGPRPSFEKNDDNVGDAEAKASPDVVTAEKQHNGIVAQPAASEESQVLASSAAVDMANEMEQPKKSTVAPSSAIIKEALGTILLKIEMPSGKKEKASKKNEKVTATTSLQRRCNLQASKSTKTTGIVAFLWPVPRAIPFADMGILATITT